MKYVVQKGAPTEIAGRRVSPGDALVLTDREAAFYVRNGALKPAPKTTRRRAKQQPKEEG